MDLADFGGGACEIEQELRDTSERLKDVQVIPIGCAATTSSARP
jgi:hypothetical protein